GRRGATASAASSASSASSACFLGRKRPCFRNFPRKTRYFRGACARPPLAHGHHLRTATTCARPPLAHGHHLRTATTCARPPLAEGRPSNEVFPEWLFASRNVVPPGEGAAKDAWANSVMVVSVGAKLMSALHQNSHPLLIMPELTDRPTLS